MTLCAEPGLGSSPSSAKWRVLIINESFDRARLKKLVPRLSLCLTSYRMPPPTLQLRNPRSRTYVRHHHVHRRDGRDRGRREHRLHRLKPRVRGLAVLRGEGIHWCSRTIRRVRQRKAYFSMFDVCITAPPRRLGVLDR